MTRLWQWLMRALRPSRPGRNVSLVIANDVMMSVARRTGSAVPKETRWHVMLRMRSPVERQVLIQVREEVRIQLWEDLKDGR